MANDDAENAKHKAMDEVEANANRAWLDKMFELTHIVCLSRAYFTSDDVMDEYHALDDEDKPVTHELRAMGPVMLRAARAGYCKKVDCAAIPSRRRSLHASPRAVWRSLLINSEPVSA